MQKLTCVGILGKERFRRAVAVGGASVGAACDGPLSALSPTGEDAHTILQLFWWMVGGGTLIWLLVMGLVLYALRPRQHDVRKVRVLLWGGGIIFPTVVLAVLLLFGLAAVPKILADGSPGSPNVLVTGEQWWWRVQYTLPDGRTFETANEVRLPVGVRTSLRLESSDVIHSFWVPKLGGKVDTIPGRTTRLGLLPTETGTFMGVCAEYCGESHAQMLLHTVVLGPDEYERWLEEQLQPAHRPPSDARGAAVFTSHGCAACHTIRGTSARGRVGPDLTHVATRTALGAGILPNDRNAFRRWLLELDQLKPEVHMPSYEMLPQDDFEALLTYLEGLK